MECEVSWNRLPTLCVSKVLEQLPCRDALLVSSTCKSWRAALGFYSGERESLKLIAQEARHERNTLVTQIFRKQLKRLTVILQCRGRELEKFLHFILMRYCESKALQSVELIATPEYLDFEEQSTIEILRSTITEPLLHSQRHSLRRIVLQGCGSLLPIELQDPEEPLAYCALRCLSASNVRRRMSFIPIHPFPFSSLQCVAMDYSSLDDIAMKALAGLPCLCRLTLNVSNLNRQQLNLLRWSDLSAYYDNHTRVTFNVITLTDNEMELLKRYVLTADIPLAVLRIFFCGYMDLGLVQSITERYCETLRELYYVDPPALRVRSYYDPLQMPGEIINPFVMMCWQCSKLELLVVHGYWLESYDLLGMARLRSSTLRRLEVSALLWDDPAQLPQPRARADRLQLNCWPSFCEEMNETLSFEWKMPTCMDLHPALTNATTKDNQYAYIIEETVADADVPLPDVT